MQWESEALIKLARKGAICLLPTRGGKYLMQDDAFGRDIKTRLRPPGGGKEREDKNLTDTIVRELREEFAIPESESREKIEFIGYTPQKKYWGTPVYLLKGHGLTPGVYQASNHPDEKVKLVEVSLDHPDYTGPRPNKLLTEWAKTFGDRLMKKSDAPDEANPYTGQEKKAALDDIIQDDVIFEAEVWEYSELTKAAIVKEEGGKFKLYTRDGTRVLGTHDSYEHALAQERAIQIRRHTAQQTVKMAAANAAGLFKQILGGKSIQAQQQIEARKQGVPAPSVIEVPSPMATPMSENGKSAALDYKKRLRALRERRGEDPETGEPLPEKSAKAPTTPADPELLRQRKERNGTPGNESNGERYWDEQMTGSPIYKVPMNEYREIGKDDRQAQWDMWGDMEDQAHGRKIPRKPLPAMFKDEIGGIPKSASGFHKPENYDTDKAISTAHYKIWLGENDWESCTTWAWVTMGRDGQDIGRVWLRLDAPQELIDAPKFDGDWGRGIITKWVARAKEEAQKRADDLEVDHCDVRLDDFEAAADGLEGVKEFGQEKTTWVEKQAAAMATEPTVDQMATAPTTGPEAIARALQNIDLGKKEAEAKAIIASKKRSKRPDAIRMLGYLDGFKRSGMHPRDLIMDKVPVIPPQFRPYTVAGETFVPGDANELYRDLINLRDVHGELEQKIGSQGAGFNRLNIYDAVKGLYGYGTPTSPKTRERGVSGFLKKITGSSPKFSYGMRRLIGRNLDYVGRGVIAVDPDLGLDEIGVPDDMLWKMYAPYVQRRLVRHGMRMEEAVKSIEGRNEHASKMLDLELQDRPVMYTRDPAWHKFNAIGGWPKRITGSTVMINPLVTSGAGADFDGDQMGIHVPSLDAAVDDVKHKLMPSKMLFSIKDRNKVVPVIKHEQVLGLYSAQHRPAKNTWSFPSEGEALKAIKSGKVSMSDEVNISQPQPTL